MWHHSIAIKALEALSAALPSPPASSSPPLRSELVALHVLPVLLHLCTQDPVSTIQRRQGERHPPQEEEEEEEEEGE